MGRAAPLMLLDDVMSELDPAHRELLVSLLEAGGQALITATEAADVPSAGATRIEVRDGTVGAGPALRAA
jgi:DNA replication and repair protein RecF